MTGDGICTAHNVCFYCMRYLSSLINVGELQASILLTRFFEGEILDWF